MLFASTTLAGRIERAEAGTARDFAERARGKGRDVLIEPVGGTFAVYGGPGEPFNKVVGLGFGTAVDADAIARLESRYDTRGAEIRVEQSTLADPAVARLLTRRGYELIGYENVLGLELTPSVVEDLTAALAADAAAGIVVSRAAPGETDLWIETATEGFLHPDSFDGPPPTESFDREVLRDVFADFGVTQGCTLYLAHRSGEIAGGGCIRIADGLAQLAGASTLPAHRRRGVQSALLRARLADAAASGCDIAIVTTEPASKSQQNVQRAGFALLYSRAVLLRPAAVGSATTPDPDRLSHG